ncbi:UPF0102 protein [Clostridia bacterium]|nr:UPF0102 protein [Clostridia bacterium]
MSQNQSRRSKTNTSKKTGFLYEAAAKAYLESKGFFVLEQNYYTPVGEIDLIAKDDCCLVFVEVKYRKDKRGGHPLETVNFKKQFRIRKAATYYNLRHRTESVLSRFDVIAILGQGEGQKEEWIHIKNAF